MLAAVLAACMAPVLGEGTGVSAQPRRPTISSCAITRFEIRGNTVLTAEELDSYLAPLAGPAVGVVQIREKLAGLQGIYRERGRPQALVRAPRQLILDGVLSIEVQEGAVPTEAAPAAPAAPAPAPLAPRTFEVREFDLQGNRLLEPATISRIFAPATGPMVSLADIQKALGELQLAYRERGFATVTVGLPQQRLTNAVVKVQVTEGVLQDIVVTGNQHFSSNNVLRALPSLATNTLMNSRVFQRELDLANQNRDRQIYPTLAPGPDPGTSVLMLRVKDRLPLHGRLEVNNQATPGTPEWRINASLQHANLWQREHQVGLSYGFTPEAFKADDVVSDYLLNRPLIAYYGAYYRLPLGNGPSVQHQIDASGGRFGYDSATRQFKLPPGGASSDLSFYYSGSSSDTGVKLGPAELVSQTPLLSIVSQDSGQNPSLLNNLGTRFNLALPVDEKRRFSLSAGLDAKFVTLESFNSNNFLITTVITNAQGSQTIQSSVSSPQPARRTDLAYVPLSLGADYSQTDGSGNLSASLNASVNALGDDTDFGAASYSRKAHAVFGRFMAAVTREQNLIGGSSAYLRLQGQAATGPLVSSEQFALGGVGSVRGYLEGDEYGDAGWFGSLELRSPFTSAQIPVGSGAWTAWLRGFVFFDAAQRYPLDEAAAGDSFRTLLSAGAGLSANLNSRIDMKITVGWPLRDSLNTGAFDPRVHFSLVGQY